MNKKWKLKWLSTSVFSLAIIVVLPIITTACSQSDPNSNSSNASGSATNQDEDTTVVVPTEYPINNQDYQLWNEPDNSPNRIWFGGVRNDAWNEDGTNFYGKKQIASDNSAWSYSIANGSYIIYVDDESKIEYLKNFFNLSDAFYNLYYDTSDSKKYKGEIIDFNNFDYSVLLNGEWTTTIEVLVSASTYSTYSIYNYRIYIYPKNATLSGDTSYYQFTIFANSTNFNNTYNTKSS